MLTRIGDTAISPDYLNQQNFSEFGATFHRDFPELFALIDQQAICGERMDGYVRSMNALSWEFESVADGGRGAAYNLAQKVVSNRRRGMNALLRCFSPTSRDMPEADTRILDVLGGDGTIARFADTLDGARPTIITADMSRYMIEACLRQGLPCIRQSATKSLFRDDTLDGVLIAYGSHHLTPEDRQLAVDEAYRTLKPGGRLVFHDFESGGKTAKWFEEVVHVYSRTGHPHPHFSRAEMWERLEMAGFRDVRVFDLLDPFELSADTRSDALNKACLHMYHMYDLVKIANAQEDIIPRVKRCIEQTLGDITVEPSDEGFIATIPRRALVAVGTKS